MINAGTVGAYLELDISGFTQNLLTAGQLLDHFRKEYDDGFSGAGGLGNALLEGLAAPILAAGKAAVEFAGIFAGASEKVRSDAETVGGAVGGIGENMQTAVQAASRLCSDEIVSSASGVAEAVRSVSAALAENGDAWLVTANQQEGCGERISNSARDCANTVSSTFAELPESTRADMLNTWSGMRDELVSGQPALFAAAKSDGDGILGGVDSALGASSASGGMRGAGKNAVDSLRKGMEDKKPNAERTMKGILDSMVTAAGSVSFTGIGGGIVSGILKGMNDKKPSLVSTAASFAVSAAAAAKRALGIHSPSRVMMEVGRYTAEGMELGLQQGAGSLFKTASAISDETAAALSGISSRGLPVSGSYSAGYGDRLDRLLDAVEKLADSQTTMEIDGRSFGRLVRSASGAR